MTRPDPDLLPICEIVGRRVYEERLRCDLTQQELADAVDVGRQHVSDIEGAREVPGFMLLCRMAAVFGIGVNELCGPRLRSRTREETTQEAS